MDTGEVHLAFDRHFDDVVVAVAVRVVAHAEDFQDYYDVGTNFTPFSIEDD